MPVCPDAAEQEAECERLVQAAEGARAAEAATELRAGEAAEGEKAAQEQALVQRQRAAQVRG